MASRPRCPTARGLQSLGNVSPIGISTSESQRRTPFALRLAWQRADSAPSVAIYSTFLQRAYDQVVHDVVVQNLPVIFCMDRAGFVGDDGPTHMGLYDIAYFRTLPNFTLMAPRNESELLPMLEHALSLNSPAGIRYPRGSTSGKHDLPLAPLLHGKAEVLRWGRGVAILAYGTTVDVALDANVDGITVVNARFAKPLDEALLLELAAGPFARNHARRTFTRRRIRLGRCGVRLRSWIKAARGANGSPERAGAARLSG